MGGKVGYDKDVIELVNLKVAVMKPCQVKTSSGKEVLLTPKDELLIVRPPVTMATFNMGDEIYALSTTVRVRIVYLDEEETTLPLLGLHWFGGVWEQIDDMTKEETEE